MRLESPSLPTPPREKPVHRNVATWQTSEVVGMAPKNCNSLRMQFLNDIIKSRHGFKTAQKFHKFRVFFKTLNL